LSWREQKYDEASIALRGRIDTALAEAASMIEAREIDLDTSLALQGEYQEVEQGWRTGALKADEALVRVDELVARARALPSTGP
jgi:hypothetical protein